MHLRMRAGIGHLLNRSRIRRSRGTLVILCRRHLESFLPLSRVKSRFRTRMERDLDQHHRSETITTKKRLPLHQNPRPANKGNLQSNPMLHSFSVSSHTIIAVVCVSTADNNICILDYCNKTNQSPPVFHSNAVTINNEVEHSVWIIMGKERLELPTTFTSLSLGQERLSKQVLSRMKQASGSKKRKVEDATTAATGQ